MLLVRALRLELRPRLWQCHLELVGPAGQRERRRYPDPVQARTATEAQETALAALLAGRRLLPGWRITCRATWWL